MKRSYIKRKPRKRKKSRLSKKKENPNSKYWQTKADHAWSDLVRAGGKCEICGEGGILHAHHLIGRSVKVHRHKPENGIALCAKHHVYDHKLSAHKAPFAFFLWVKEHRPDVYFWCENNRWLEGPHNYEEAYHSLMALHPEKHDCDKSSDPR